MSLSVLTHSYCFGLFNQRSSVSIELHWHLRSYTDQCSSVPIGFYRYVFSQIDQCSSVPISDLLYRLNYTDTIFIGIRSSRSMPSVLLYRLILTDTSSSLVTPSPKADFAFGEGGVGSELRPCKVLISSQILRPYGKAPHRVSNLSPRLIECI